MYQYVGCRIIALGGPDVCTRFPAALLLPPAAVESNFIRAKFWRNSIFRGVEEKEEAVG